MRRHRRNLTGVDWRARNRVLREAVAPDIDLNTRVASTVRAGEFDTSRVGRSSASDRDLLLIMLVDENGFRGLLHT